MTTAVTGVSERPRLLRAGLTVAILAGAVVAVSLGVYARVHHPAGRVGPGFAVRDLLVWGFTAGLLDALLRMGGWERPWRPAACTVRPRC